jgi:hypothetical protein
MFELPIVKGVLTQKTYHGSSGTKSKKSQKADLDETNQQTVMHP